MARAEDVKVKPRSKRAKRIMEKREPKLVRMHMKMYSLPCKGVQCLQ